MRLVNRSYTQVKVEVSEGLGGGVATERVNLVLENYLRNYVNADQTDWADHISMAEFSYNNIKHLGTGFSPFMVVFETELLSPIDLAL